MLNPNAEAGEEMIEKGALLNHREITNYLFQN
jgi:hypothetical protein